MGDYGYGASKECTKTLYNYSGDVLCKITNNWLDKSQNEWLLSQMTYYSCYAFNVVSSGSIIYADAAADYNIRPILSLSSNVKISGGEGTSSNPYTLSQ